MNILVTGSAGFIGRAVVRELESRGDVVIPFDKPNDVRDIEALKRNATRVSGIVNLAGMLGTPELFGHEQEAATVNILGALNVYDVAAYYDIPVVQIGTGHKGQPNPYAVTKGCAEDLGLCRAKYMQQKIAVVRAYHVYGPHQPVGPPHGTSHVNKFFPTFACRAMTGMSLELCGGGNQVIDPVYVDDVADVLVSALAGPYGTVIEAGCGQGIRVGTVAADIAYAAKAQVPVLGTNVRDGEPKDAIVVASDPRCFNPWPYKVAETVDWYRQWLLSSR